MDRAKSHRGLTFKDMERLTVNERGQICLDGYPIEVQRMRLTRTQAVVGIVTAVAIVAQAAIFISQALKLLP